MSEPQNPGNPGPPPEAEPPTRPDLFATRTEKGRTPPRLEDTVRILSTVKPSAAQADANSARKRWLALALLTCAAIAAAWYMVNHRSIAPTATDPLLVIGAALPTSAGAAASAVGAPPAFDQAASEASPTAVAQAGVVASGAASGALPDTVVATAATGMAALTTATGMATAASGPLQAAAAPTSTSTSTSTTPTGSTTTNPTAPSAAPAATAGSATASRPLAKADATTPKAELTSSARQRTVQRKAGSKDPNVVAKASAKSVAKANPKASTRTTARANAKATAKSTQVAKAAKAKREDAARVARAKRRDTTTLAAAPTSASKATEPVTREGELDASVIEALLPYVKRTAAVNAVRAAPAAAASATPPSGAGSRVATNGKTDEECAQLTGSAAVSCQAHLCAGRRGQDADCPALPLAPR